MKESSIATHNDSEKFTGSKRGYIVEWQGLDDFVEAQRINKHYRLTLYLGATGYLREQRPQVPKVTYMTPIRGRRLESGPSSATGGARTPANVTCPHEGAV